MAHVFISYSREDRDFAELLMRELSASGVTTWIDSEQLRVGKDWQQQIDEAIKQSFALLLIVTANAKQSEYVTYEWSFAYGSNVKVLPLLRSETEIHSRLKNIQHFDFTQKHRPFPDVIKEIRKLKEEYETAATKLQLSSVIDLTVGETDDKINKLIADLHANDIDENDRRSSAVSALIPIGKKAIPGVLYALNSYSSDVRKAAAYILGWIGDDSIVGDLEDQLYDESTEDVRKIILRSLKRIGTPWATYAIEQWRSSETQRDDDVDIDNLSDIPF